MAQTVSYDSAMASLHSMFSGVDNEVIAMLLQANNGHLERTVEQLLGITGGAVPGDSSIPTNAGPGAAGAAAAASGGLSVPSSAASRRKSSAASGGSNLPDDFLRPPSYFANLRVGGGRRGSAAQAQIDQDAILAQMLEDEMFMADIRANPQLYYPDEPQHQQHQQQHHGHPGAAAAPPSSAPSASHSYAPPSHHPAAAPSQWAPPPASASRGDFSGMGTAPSAQSFRDKFNSLTSAAKQRLLDVASRLRHEGGAAAPAAAAKTADRESLASSLLSDADTDDSGAILSERAKSSERAEERDVEPAALSADSVHLEDGVYTQDDAEAGTGAGYVPPSHVGDLNMGGAGGRKRWGRNNSSGEENNS